MNLFAGASPVAQGGGDHAAMDFTLITGDQADNMQRNEMLWTRALLEGTPIDPNSGSQNPLDWDPLMHPSCAAYTPTPANLAEAAKYTGVQDYDDYDEGPNPYFYDPDDVQGTWAQGGWPSYPGLMDRAQLPFTAAGLSVPSYVTNGNHDGLVQGNQAANPAFEDIAMGCFKALGSTSSPAPGQPPDGLDPSLLLTPSVGMLVPPDPLRRFVDKKQIKQIYGANGQDDAHGYDFVDEDENINSAFGASYYAWDPPEAPGMRYISIDTLSEGGITGQSSSGNIDDPQFQWLERELRVRDGQRQADRGVRTSPDPVAQLERPGRGGGSMHRRPRVPRRCARARSEPGLRHRPARVDAHPLRRAEPAPARQHGRDRVELFNRFPHVLTYVAGHTHENRVQPFTRAGGGVWWGIETAATADWPVQHRLIELMDNRDGTLSIFGTILDAASSGSAPAPGSAVAFDEAMLASLGPRVRLQRPAGGPRLR